MKILVAPASHPEYFYINTGYNSQWVATTGTGFIGIGTSFPDIHFVVTSSGTVGSADRVMAIRRGFAGADSSMVTTYGTPYLLIGGRETRTNSIQTIGFGYNTTTSFQPAEIGFLTTSTTGNTQGSIVFANRNGTTNVAPTEVMRITSTGAVGIGTAIPNAGLDLSGTLRVADGSQGLGKILTSDASGYATWASPSNNSTQSYTGARYVSYMSSPQATTLNTPVNIPQLTSINIPPGYYSFRIIAKFRSSATGNGMGLTLTNGTATMTGFIAEQRAQRTTILNDPASLIAPGDMNVGTASPAANTDYFSMVEGGFQVTATGTVIAQFQSEVSGNTTTLQPGSFMVIEALTNSFGLTGLGTQNYVTKLDALGGITMSQIFDTGTGVGIGTTSPGAKLDVSGDALINGITV